MKLIIVTGMSGAGKSKAVDYLEDAGYTPNVVASKAMYQ